jgi:acyl-homoserine lactone acylase PvdQ
MPKDGHCINIVTEEYAFCGVADTSKCGGTLSCLYLPGEPIGGVGPVDVDHPFEQHTVPGYREIIDLSPANDSRFAIDVGQSGHPMSAQYDDFLRDWQAVKHRKMRMDRPDIERGAIGRLRLTPQKN